MTTPFQKASEWIDAENAQDPNIELDQKHRISKRIIVFKQDVRKTDAV